MICTFAFPTIIVLGEDSVQEVKPRLSALAARKPLVVTDRGLVSTPTFERALEGLAPECAVFSDIQSNPVEANVEAAREAYIQNGCDCVIAVGGGSAIDVAKVVRLRVKLPRWRLLDEIRQENVAPLAPFVAIPTTAGTGSEVGRSSVITIDRQKRVIFHPSLLANLVVLDPRLTTNLPPKLTAATGADALTHCIESFTSPVYHPLCDGIALEGIHLIAKALPRAVKEPMNLDARKTMLIAASMGGIAFQKDLGAAHSLAHPLSSICGLHHGLANALVLPTVMRFNAARKPGLYERVGIAMELKEPSDQQTIAAVESLLQDIGISGGLAAHGVKEDQLDALTHQAVADSCHQTNPVPVSRQDLYDLYRQAT